MAKKNRNEEIDGTCIDCVHSFDYHELNYKKEPFLCKCPFFTWDRFLNKDNCNNFKKRKR